MPPELIKELIGAKGIGTHYLCEEVGPEVDPLSPQNKLIFVVGPMGGTHDARQQPLRPVLRLAAHRRLRRVLLGRQPHAAVRPDRLQGRHRRGQGRRRRSTSRSARRAPPSTTPTTSGASTPSRPRTRSSRAPTHKKAQACVIGQAGENAGALRLRQQQQLAPARPRRPRRRVSAPRTSRASSGTARRRSRSRVPTTSRPSSGTSSSAPRTTPAWPPTSAAAPSTWCAS